MKSLFSTVLLSAWGLIAFGQSARPTGEVAVGYVRETFKMRDEQVSPLLYVANLNGVRVGYAQRWSRHQLRIAAQGTLGDFVAPGVGIRSVNFTPQSPDAQAVTLLPPKLYQASFEADYLFRIHQRSRGGLIRGASAWGVGFNDNLHYADGVALTTWAMNTASFSLLYQTYRQWGTRHRLTLDASLPLLSAISRIPYANVISEPDRSNVEAFFETTPRLSFTRLINPRLSLAYRLAISPRVALQASYRFGWLRYPDPQLIRTASHSGQCSIVYNFNFSEKQ